MCYARRPRRVVRGRPCPARPFSNPPPPDFHSEARAQAVAENRPQPSRPNPLGALPRSAPSRSSCARSSSRPAARPSAQRSAAWALAAHTRSQTWSLDRARPTRRSQPPLLPARGAHRGGHRSPWRASAPRRATSLTATRTASRLCCSSRRRSVRRSVRRSTIASTLHATHRARIIRTMHDACYTARYCATARCMLVRTTARCTLHMHCCCPAHRTRASPAILTTVLTTMLITNHAHHYTYTYRRTTSTRASPTITPSPHSSRPCSRRACHQLLPPLSLPSYHPEPNPNQVNMLDNVVFERKNLL